MAISVGTLLIEMSANVARLQEDMNSATRTVQNAAQRMADAFEVVKKAFVIRELYEFGKAVVEEAMQAEQAANRLTAVYKNQGEQIGLTRHQLDDLAESLAASSQFKDNDIKRGEAELIKFGNIYGDVFTRATKLSIDLGAQTGNLPGAFDAIGKALANPVDGLKGLGGEIGKLLPQQREHIKTLMEQGRTYDAQVYVLDILQKKIGGTADIMNTGYTKAITDVNKGWEKMLENLGEITAIKNTVVGALEAIAGALRGMASVFGGGTFSEGVLGKRDAMAMEIMDLEKQIQDAQARRGLTFTDDEGRVIGEDLRADELIAKRDALQKKYDELVKQENAKQEKPPPESTLEQIAFSKSLDRQLAATGLQGPIGGLLAQAAELHMTDDKTTQKILAIVGALNKEAQAVEEAKRAWAAYNAIQNLKDDLTAKTKDLKEQTAALGQNSLQIQILTASQQMANDVRRLGINMTASERDELTRVSSALGVQYIAALRAAYEEQRKWQTGFKTAMSTIVEDSTNAAAQINGLFTNAFKGMEDALVGFVKTGKIDFRSLADSIITDLIRIRIQQSITAPLAGALNGPAGTAAVGGLLNLLGIGNFGATQTGQVSVYGPQASNWVPQARASGGDVAANQPYWVGENGPELFMPQTGGTILPNGAGGAVQVGSINIGQGASPESVQEAFRQLRDLRASVGPIAVAAVAQERQRGRAGLR